MSDQQITCSECGSVFVFKEAEQAFYAERGLASPPKRCRECRQARKAQNGQGGGRPPAGGGGRDRGRFTGDPNEYRSPMGADGGYRGGPPRAGGFDRPRGGGFGAPRGGGFDRPRTGGGFDRGNGAAGPRTGGFDRPRAGGGFDRPRTGGFDRPGGDARPPRRFDGAPRKPRAEWGSSPTQEHAPPPAEGTEARAERPARQRPERPRYDITCAECGTPAQVPFKPLEGRQVYCQPCYRARKGTAAPAEPTELESDNGIVE